MKQQIGRLLSTLLLATFSLGITAGVIQGTIIDKPVSYTHLKGILRSVPADVDQMDFPASAY